MTDIHALSGAYAVDALSDDERADFEIHLSECPACRAEVDSLREAAALLPLVSQIFPSDHVRASVLAGIANVRPLPPLEEPKHRQEPEPEEQLAEVVPLRRRPVRMALTAVAAAVILAVGVGVTVQQPWAGDSSETQADFSEADRIMQADDVESYAVDPTTIGGAEATVYRSPDNDAVALVTHNMAPAGDGRVYQLWLQAEDGSMKSAGIMPDGPDNKVVLAGDGSDAIGAGITVEPTGGSDSPTSPPVALVSFESA